MKKLINKLIKKAKPFFADYRVTVHCGTTGRERVYHAWTHQEAIEWASLQCSDDLCIIRSSWFSGAIVTMNGSCMSMGFAK